MRASEAAQLKVCDIDGSRMVITIRGGKGNKDRQVMLSPTLREVLVAYYRGKPGRPISCNAIFETCRKAARTARIAKPVHPHSLRHAFATHGARVESTFLLEDCVNLLVIKALPGHRNPKTSANYLHVANTAVSSTRSPLELLGALDLVRAASAMKAISSRDGDMCLAIVKEKPSKRGHRVISHHS